MLLPPPSLRSPGYRLQDKTPAPLNQLDGLMHETYDSLMDLGLAMDQAQAALHVASKRLAGVTQLMLLLVRWRFGLNDAEAAVLKGCLPPVVGGGGGAAGERTRGCSGSLATVTSSLLWPTLPPSPLTVTRPHDPCTHPASTAHPPTPAPTPTPTLTSFPLALL